MISENDIELAGGVVLPRFRKDLAQTALRAGILYPNVATGRAAVADGAFFLVVGSSPSAYSIYRRDSSSTQTFIDSVPGSSAVNAIDARVEDLEDAVPDKAAKGVEVAAGALAGIKGADIASASTVNLATATGDYVVITGTTTITSLGTVAAGLERTLQFAGILTLTHNAVSLILPGGVNIVTAAGDVAVFRSLGSGNWRWVGGQQSRGLALSGEVSEAAARAGTAGPEAGGMTARTTTVAIDENLDPVKVGMSQVVEYTGTAPYDPILVGSNGVMAVGVDKVSGKLAGTAVDALLDGVSTLARAPVKLAEAVRVAVTQWLGSATFSQSLGVGAQGQPPLSTTQPYHNLTFTGGPKTAVGSGTASSKALVEDSLQEGGTVGGNRGETICSGLANWAVQLAAVENGIDPADLVIFASAPGQGGMTIDQLDKGTIYWTRMMGHISAMQTLATAAGKSFSVPAVPFVQGETDAGNGTDFATYLAKLLQVSADLNTDIPAITGQTTPVHLLLYQTVSRIATNEHVALAQLEAVRQSDLIHFVTPIYDLTHAGDDLHLINTSYLRLGRLFGRAWKQLVIDQCVPDCIWPISATAKGQTIRIRFDAPTPLVLDTVGLAATTNFGFRVTDGTGDLTLSGIQVVDGNEVEITVHRALGTSPVVRYALDHLGTGLTIEEGASGNLRDTTADTCKVSGVTYPMWHVAPAFELPVLNLDATS